MQRRLAVLGIMLGAALSACGTLLAAPDDDDLPAQQPKGDSGNALEGNDGTTGGADGSQALDAATPSDGAFDADAADAQLAASDQYRAAVMSDTPIAYWRFAEPLGSNLYASETNQHPLSAGAGTKAPTIAVPGIFGASSHALLFNAEIGVNASSASLPFLGSTTFTFEAWMRVGTALDDSFRHLFQHSNGSISYGIYLYGPEGIVIERIAAGNKAQVQALNLALNTWHHVVATRDGGGQIHLFIDGQESMTASNFNATPIAGGSFTLGTKSVNDPSLPNNTSVAEVAVYDKALSSTRIAAHFALGP